MNFAVSLLSILVQDVLEDATAGPTVLEQMQAAIGPMILPVIVVIVLTIIGFVVFSQRGRLNIHPCANSNGECRNAHTTYPYQGKYFCIFHWNQRTAMNSVRQGPVSVLQK